MGEISEIDSSTVDGMQKLFVRQSLRMGELEADLATAREQVELLTEGLKCQIKYCSNGSRHITAVKALAALTRPVEIK